MYTTAWVKYLPIIKILLKKSLQTDQELPLNRIDFEKLGLARKATNKFTVVFENGKAANTVGSTQIARDMVTVLSENNDTKFLFKHNTYEITLNSKFTLVIVNKTKNPVPLPTAEPETNTAVEE